MATKLHQIFVDEILGIIIISMNILYNQLMITQHSQKSFARWILQQLNRRLNTCSYSYSTVLLANIVILVQIKIAILCMLFQWLVVQMELSF